MLQHSPRKGILLDKLIVSQRVEKFSARCKLRLNKEMKCSVKKNCKVEANDVKSDFEFSVSLILFLFAFLLLFYFHSCLLSILRVLYSLPYLIPFL